MISKYSKIVYLLGTILLMVIAGCRPSDTDINNTVPTSQETIVKDYDDAEGPKAISIPTASRDSGVIYGRLISEFDGNPIVNHLVYLGERLPLTPGDEYLITLQAQGSPHVPTDNSGQFVFIDVAPGDYPMIIWSPSHSLVIPNETGTEELNVSVKAGEVTELGDLVVKWP